MERRLDASRRDSTVSRSGATLLEVAVVIGVLSLLTALVIPAVQHARETVRRQQCTSNLHQIGVAWHGYIAQHGAFPTGMCNPPGLVRLMPYVELESAAEYYKKLNELPGGATSIPLPVYYCPSDPIAGALQGFEASYLENEGSGQQAYGQNGVVEMCDKLGPRDVTDGLSNTAAMAEHLINGYWIDASNLPRPDWATRTPFHGTTELDRFADECLSDRKDPWTKGGFRHSVPLSGLVAVYNHVLPPNTPACYNGPNSGAIQSNLYGSKPASSLHPAGANVLFADGAVRFVSSSVDRQLWRASGSRNGNEVAHFDF